MRNKIKLGNKTVGWCQAESRVWENKSFLGEAVNNSDPSVQPDKWKEAAHAWHGSEMEFAGEMKSF